MDEKALGASRGGMWGAVAEKTVSVNRGMGLWKAVGVNPGEGLSNGEMNGLEE